MDTHNLAAFVQVAETGSFSRAAERLHLTQPAVSKRVAMLEQQLGTALFDRIGRQVSLTEAGAALLPHARLISRALEAATQSVRDLSGEVAGQLRLATSHHIGLHRLPPVLSAFNQGAPAVDVDIEFMDSEQAYERIFRGTIELAVVTLAPQAETSLVTLPLWRDQLLFMAGRNHALAAGAGNQPSPRASRRPPEQHLARLSAVPAVLPGLGTYTGQIIKRLFERYDLPLNVSLGTNYLETIRMMASVGLGWTVLPHTMRDESLVVLDVPGVSLQRDLGLVHHRDRSLSRAARAFVDTLRGFSDRDEAHPAGDDGGLSLTS